MRYYSKCSSVIPIEYPMLTGPRGRFFFFLASRRTGLLPFAYEREPAVVVKLNIYQPHRQATSVLSPPIRPMRKDYLIGIKYHMLMSSFSPGAGSWILNITFSTMAISCEAKIPS